MLFEPAQRIKGKSRRERSLSPLALYVPEPPVTVAVVRRQGRNPNPDPIARGLAPRVANTDQKTAC